MMGTVVVVEPDSGFRALLGEWLLGRMFRVEMFATIGAASAALGAADVLVIDLSSPRVAPSVLLAGVRARHPRVRCVGLSTRLSHSLSASSTAARTLGLAALIAKPCEQREVIEAVEKAMETTDT